MLKNIKQISLSLACMILLIHAVIPHHHHPDKIVCISQISHDDCQEKHSCCDSHGSSNHANQNDFDKSHCIIDDFFTVKQSQTLNQTLTPVQIQTIDLFLNILDCEFFYDEKGKVFRRDNRNIIYDDPFAIANVGLRAPPLAIFC